jgi:hypothetical protein
MCAAGRGYAAPEQSLAFDGSGIAVEVNTGTEAEPDG